MGTVESQTSCVFVFDKYLSQNGKFPHYPLKFEPAKHGSKRKFGAI